MSVILHLADAHFGTETTAVVEALVALAREQSPDLVILSGDATMRGRRSQFMATHQFLTRLASPNILVIPGNHDIPLYNLAFRVFTPYGNYRRVFGRVLEPEFDSADLLVIGVNTTRPWRHKDGVISLDQVKRVSRRLKEASPAQLRIVVTHQPVRVTRSSDEKNLLHGREAAVRAWAEAGADLVLSGHIHLPHVRPLREIYPDLPRPLWSVLAGTAVSSRVRGDIPNSVNVIRYLSTAIPRQCTLERWDFDGKLFRIADRQTVELQQAR
jgi:3',5'-cyclic AMP phosphodiesterase CpdA